jgi:hypothetical protein
MVSSTTVVDVEEERKTDVEANSTPAQLDVWCRAIPAGCIARHLNIASHFFGSFRIVNKEVTGLETGIPSSCLMHIV